MPVTTQRGKRSSFVTKTEFIERIFAIVGVAHIKAGIVTASPEYEKMADEVLAAARQYREEQAAPAQPKIKALGVAVGGDLNRWKSKMG